MSFSLPRLLTLLLLFFWIFIELVSGLKDEEPFCTSKFDYDYKMLQKVVMLEMEYNKLIAQIREVTATVETLGDQLKDEMEQRKAMDTKLHTFEGVERLGATYIRWGRTTCPGNGTDLIYKGYAAGSLYSNAGAAANYLCLPEEPLWNIYQDGDQTGHGVYGTEYEFLYRNTEKFFGKQLTNKDAPCCVCYTKRSVVMMLPGRNQCFNGWTLEYQGYLVAGYDGHQATEFVCLDNDAEALSGGNEDVNGKLFYMSEAKCGSLRCPPYVQGRELTCSVCSK